ncbi:uncharacterized protein LOC123524306 [Mercenaria mercenaria]|uniref:uncharacterized protein LOC123524306 n=1 Tax=Mercenaria mercenaria TaxID=6596 RepID=UPI00234EB4AC|nr:uncharacterized protein LOC123524306 [Mercenaria mercenaria]
MSRFREIGVQTTPDDDDVFDISPTSTLHRGSLTSPTSLGHQSSIIARFRNSISSPKVKDLKRQLRECEEESARINIELQSTTQENSYVNRRLANIVKDNPFNIYINGASGDVNVGNTNTVVNQSTETVVADLEELTGKLTFAVQENTQERTNTEMKLKSTEVLLKEMKDSLQICTSMLDKLDKNTSNKLGNVKQLLESLTSDRSDDRVIVDGIGRLQQYVIDRKRIVRAADELPWGVQVAVTRLVNKFGHLTWQEFAEILEVKVSSIQARGRNENTDDAEQPEHFDRDMCARILAQWITQSRDNDGHKLLNIVQGFEAQRCREMTETFQKKTVGQSLIPTVVLQNEQNQRSSMAYSETSAGSSQSWGMRRVPSQQLPDHRSQFEHQLEAWKLQVEMNAKLDKMLTLMTEEKKPAKKGDMKFKEEEVLYKKVFDEGQFV